MPSQDDVDFGGSGGSAATSGSTGQSGSSTSSAGHGGSVANSGGTTSTTGGGGAFGAAGTGGTSSGTSGATNGGSASGGTAGSAGGSTSGGTTGSAGKGGSASGGTTGSAGKGGSASGGSTSGGSTGSGGSVSNGGFVVQYTCLKTAAMSAYVEAEINAKNTGSSTIPVAELKLRYYFTDEPRVTNQMTNNFSHISTAGSNQTLNVTSVVAGLVPTVTGADTYIEFSFTSDHSLAPGEAMDFAWQMDGPDQSKDIYNQSNDYSFDASKTAPANWDHLVLFHNGTVVWGALP